MSEPKKLTNKIIKSKVNIDNEDNSDNAEVIIRRQVDSIYEKIGANLNKALGSS